MKEDDIKNYIASYLPNWTIKEGKLSLEIKTQDWNESMAIANMISYLAEKFNHHPELFISYSRMKINLITYSENAITDKDLKLAEKITNMLAMDT